MQRPRFRLRFLMALVALAGIAMFGIKIVRTMRYCDAQITKHRTTEQNLLRLLPILEDCARLDDDNLSASRKQIDNYKSRLEHLRQGPSQEIQANLLKELIQIESDSYRNTLETVRSGRDLLSDTKEQLAYYSQMRQKYVHAKRRPWLPIPPDPPPPDAPPLDDPSTTFPQLPPAGDGPSVMPPAAPTSGPSELTPPPIPPDPSCPKG